ncbi:hypothetical protein [Sinorhizobium medicae]|uniref:hypothetical protein n=1 Tax=Sinorhizobium medicae TaxID=110321 RepID=UPI0011B82E1E|nr:hypothetical protein [Sinorhizobium medicae]
MGESRLLRWLRLKRRLRRNGDSPPLRASAAACSRPILPLSDTWTIATGTHWTAPGGGFSDGGASGECENALGATPPCSTVPLRPLVAAVNPGEGSDYQPHRRGNVRKLDEREQQRGNPERMIVGKEHDYRQRSDDLQICFACKIRRVLGQGMPPQIRGAHEQKREHHNHDHHSEQEVHFPLYGDENRHLFHSAGCTTIPIFRSLKTWHELRRRTVHT